MCQDSICCWYLNSVYQVLYFQLFNYFQLLRLISDYLFRNLIFILWAIAGGATLLKLSDTMSNMNTQYQFYIFNFILKYQLDEETTVEYD
mgnify:CR=1 FL=1